MPEFVQAQRTLTIASPLAQDVLIVTGVQAREAISQLFQVTVDVVSEQADKVRFDQLLGQEVTVGLGREESAAGRYFSGIVRTASQGGRTMVAKGNEKVEFTHYRLELVPKFWLLTRIVRSRIFELMKVPDILKRVLQDAGINADYQIEGTADSFKPRDYCVQYRESDFDFVSRLMEEEGIYYFFKHSASGHRMVLANSPSKHPEIGTEIKFEPLGAMTGEVDRVSGWEKAQELRAGKYALRDYCFEMPGSKLETSKPSLQDVQVGVTKHKLSLGANSSLELYEHPGRYAQRFDGVTHQGGDSGTLRDIFPDGDRTVAIRMQAEAAAAMTIRGSGGCPYFEAGSKFTLHDHPTEDDTYVLTSVDHMIEQPIGSGTGERPFSYESHFTCIPFALPYRPPRVTPTPVVHGTQTAVVVGQGEIDTDKYGRIKVKFHWDREDQDSCWARVATFWAGEQWGAIHIPRVGQEVVVAFEEGDPDQPIVVGSVYNATNMPPYKLPDNKTQSGIKSRSSMQGGADNYNEIRFEDQKGSEEILIHAEKDLKTEVEHDETRTVGHDRTTTIKHDETKTVEEGNETITIKQGKQTITIQQDQTLEIKKGNQTVTIDMGNQSTTIKMGNQTTKVNLGSISTEAMQSIELKVGQSSVKLDQTGVTIKGIMINIQGQAQVQVQGLMTQIKGDAMLQEQGGIVMIN